MCVWVCVCVCQDDDLTIEGLPEALWLSDGERVGVGAYLGFLPCVTSLIAVNTYFSSLVQQPAMHPMLELNSSPKQHIAERWTGEARHHRRNTTTLSPPPPRVSCMIRQAVCLSVVRCVWTTTPPDPSSTCSSPWHHRCGSCASRAGGAATKVRLLD